MSWLLEIVDGSEAGRRYVLEPGTIAHVGRSGWAEFRIRKDPTIADAHFVLECSATECVARDLDTPGGTLVNGQRVDRAVLRDGDQVRAGGTTFVARWVELEPGAPTAATPAEPAAPPPQPEPALGPRHYRVATLLRSQPGGLFGVLDGARSPMILGLLLESAARWQSLYEGTQGEALGLVAPHLVALPPGERLLEPLVVQGWGASWGIYLTSDRPFEEVRKQLRRFLMVELPGAKRVYFRFYDPRVLRTYLPTCTVGEARAFLGPINAFLLESSHGDALARFTLGADGFRRELLKLETG